MQHLPYPYAPTKKDKERQYARVLNILKRLQINIPYVEALEHMPTYGKFMKENLMKIMRYMDKETIHLCEIYSPLYREPYRKKKMILEELCYLLP